MALAAALLRAHSSAVAAIPETCQPGEGILSVCPSRRPPRPSAVRQLVTATAPTRRRASARVRDRQRLPSHGHATRPLPHRACLPSEQEVRAIRCERA